MLLISHSLGGFILKQAFCVANQQLHRYEYLVNQVAGIIFISTPHFVSEQQRPLETLLLMLKASTRISLKLSPQKTEEVSFIILNLSARFEEIHLRAPILSIYETKETRVQDGIFRHKSAIVGYLRMVSIMVSLLMSYRSLIVQLAQHKLPPSNF